MRVSPCTALGSVDARPSPRHARPWSVQSATGAQHLCPATASAEGTPFHGRPASAETLVRVLAPPVKAGISQGRSAPGPGRAQLALLAQPLPAYNWWPTCQGRCIEEPHDPVSKPHAGDCFSRTTRVLILIKELLERRVLTRQAQPEHQQNTRF